MITIVGVAWAIGAAIVSGGGTAVVMSSRHKLKIAELQDKINSLQKEIELYQENELKLMQTIEELIIERAKLIKELSELEVSVENLLMEKENILKIITKNDGRFRRIIAALTFQIKNLEKETINLKEKVNILEKEHTSLCSSKSNILFKEEQVDNKLAITQLEYENNRNDIALAKLNEQLFYEEILVITKEVS